MKKWIYFKEATEFWDTKITKLIARFATALIWDRSQRKHIRGRLKKKINATFFGNRYYCIFSAGEACFISSILENTGLRKFSGPMDWMYGGGPITRLNLIVDGYKNYFDKDDLKFEYYSKPSGCDVYLNKQTGLHYNHDFPGHGSFDKDYPAIYEKYQSRISRVVNMMKSGSKTLIIYASLEKSLDCPHQPELSEISKTVQQINNTYGNNVDVLYLAHNDEMKPGTARLMPKKSNLIYGEYFGYNSDPDSTTAPKTLAVLSIVISYVVRKNYK